MTLLRSMLFIAAVSLVAGWANASDRPDGPPQGRHPMMNPEKINCDERPRMEHFKEKLNLLPDQEARLAVAFKQHCETMKSAHQTLQSTMKQVLSAEQQQQLETMHKKRRHDGRDDDHHGEHEHH